MLQAGRQNVVERGSRNFPAAAATEPNESNELTGESRSVAGTGVLPPTGSKPPNWEGRHNQVEPRITRKR